MEAGIYAGRKLCLFIRSQAAVSTWERVKSRVGMSEFHVLISRWCPAKGENEINNETYGGSPLDFGLLFFFVLFVVPFHWDCRQGNFQEVISLSDRSDVFVYTLINLPWRRSVNKTSFSTTSNSFQYWINGLDSPFSRLLFLYYRATTQHRQAALKKSSLYGFVSVVVSVGVTILKKETKQNHDDRWLVWQCV